MSDPHDTTSTTPPVSGAGSARGRFDRRTMLKWSIRLGAGAFALAFALPALALKTLQLEQKTIAAGDTLVYAGGARLGQPVHAADLRPGEGVQAF
ncbi:MAG TPA: hypothetical protein VFW96_15725, partial [Thermomicrobiales bacterium]|nr:hypothetical protein [Thermomicrobiales bacterium]